MGYGDGGWALGEGKGQNTEEQVPTHLNGYSSMKGMIELGERCVPPLLIYFPNRPVFLSANPHLLLPDQCENNNAEGKPLLDFERRGDNVLMI